ncbi:MAG: hypothetical protein WC693_04185 [Patescibacteria group bacterium]|jgi:hypothetical protein
MFKPEIIKGGQDKPLAQSADFITRTIEKSEIKEGKVFSQGEILGIIEQIAKQEGIKQGQLEISEETYDSKGNIIVLSVKAIEGKARGQGWTSIEYTFMIKGDHDTVGGSLESGICRMYNLETGDPEGGEVATYRDGAWILSPGEIAPKVSDLNII